VGIVRAGTMVASGTVDELRAGGPAQLVVDAPQARDGWADGLPGVTVHDRNGSRTVLELAEGADDQPVLAAALATGPVHEFARRQPSLTELFRHVVSEEVAA
jgi:ABC-2 type transport system ATP-binding protein